MTNNFKQAALDYHALPSPGKISIELTTPAETQYDLALAYSPGVAEPCREIAANPEAAYQYTGKGNLVAVISNGTAVLGLGNIGALASKPVMEGKALLFKRFAGINSIDLQVDTEDVDEFVSAVGHIALSFGGINLEDIKAPECFEIERRLQERCDIPVFHDDQHGTAIVTAAGMLNALDLQGKALPDVRIVCLGAGAAAIVCMRLLVSLGARQENIFMVDRRGVIHQGRDDINEFKAEFAQDTKWRDLSDACAGADVFVGLAGANLLSAELLKSMAPNPVVFACSNPDPEISPELVHATRDDVIIATGRSDYPNQVNNVLCFPFIFRGALDVRACCVNEAMKIAAVHAIRELARLPVPQEVLTASGVEHLEFGKSYIIPMPTDRRLLSLVSAAVAGAAVESGVAGQALPEEVSAGGVSAGWVVILLETMNPLPHFNHTPATRADLTYNITRFKDQRQPLAALRHAAVAVTVFDHSGEAAIILTRRSEQLKEHSGQWAMPGGRVDPGETVIEAALRELHEEVNLALDADKVIGLLDDYVTRSGYVITPVVIWADVDDRHLTPNPQEVESIHGFTFTELSRSDSPNLETIPQSDRQVLSMHYLDDLIYAPTAAMLYQFREVAMHGRSIRVLHYEQPVFAWR